MAAFRANSLQVLLATSLIEVGVDVPNATLMVVENAEQLAALRSLGARYAQGFLWSAGIAADEVPGWLAAQDTVMGGSAPAS